MPTTETRDDRSGAEVAGGRAAGNGRSQRADHGPDPLRGGELSDPLQCEGGGPGIVPETAAEGASGPGGKLPFFSLLQSSFGEHDLSGARAHTGPEARQATGDLAAKGYTSGSDVVLDAGADLHTVAHEAAHYVQQQQGVQLYGGIGKPGDPWERHADAVADAVVAGQPAGPVLDAMPGGAAGGVQLKGTGEAKTNESLISKLLEQIMSQISEPYSGQREEIEQQAREQSSEDSTLDTAVAWLEQQRDQGRLKNIGGVDVRMEKLTELYDRQRQLKVRLGDVPSIEEVSSWRQEALDLSVDEPTLVKSEELLQKRIEEAGPRTEGLVALDLALDGLGKLESSFELDTRNSKAALAVEGSNGDLMAAARLVETWTTTREQELKRPVEELGGKIKGEYGKQRVTRTGQRQAPPKDESVDVHVNDALKLSPDLRDTTEAQGALQQRLDTAQGDTAKMEKIDKLIDDLAPFYNGQEKWKNTRLTKALQSGDLGSAISNLEQDLENKIKEKKKPVLDLVGRLGQEAKKQQVIPWLARPALSDEAVLGVEKEAFELSPNLMDLSAAKKHVTERLQRETAETGWLRDISDQVVVMARLHSELEEGQQEGWATSALSEAGSLKDAVGLMKKRVEDRKLELMRPFDEQISQIGQEHEKQRNLTTRMKKPPEESQLVSLKSQAEKKLGGNYLDLSKGTEFLSQSLQTAQQDTMTMTEVSERIEAFAELSPEFGETERQQLLTEARGSHKSRRKDNELGPWLQEEKERRKKKLVEPLESLVKLVIAEREKQEKYNDLASVLGERGGTEALLEDALGSTGLKNAGGAKVTLEQRLKTEKEDTAHLEGIDKALSSLIAMHTVSETNTRSSWLQKAVEAAGQDPGGVKVWLEQQGQVRHDELTKGLDERILKIKAEQVEQKKAKTKPMGGIKEIDEGKLKELAISKAPSLLDLTLAETFLDEELSKQQTLTTTLFGKDRVGARSQKLNPSLKLNFTVTITGAKLLKWFDEVTRAELPDLYDESEPTRNKNKVEKTLNKDNWISTFSELHRKDIWQEKDPRHRPNKGGSQFTNIGKLGVGGNDYNVEEKMWVKPNGQDRATRYNVLGDHLAQGKTAPERAKGIRSVLQGNYDEADEHETEAALAMLGAETARNPRSYGVGLMLLDSVEQGQKYGKNNDKDYTWDGLLGSKKKPMENDTQFENRKTKGTSDKVNRWKNMKEALVRDAPNKFHNSPFKALWAGKWSMSPSASMSLGARDTAISNDGNKLNTIQYKEVKTILHWLELVLPGMQLEVTNESDAEKMLKRIFKLRLSKPDKLEASDVLSDLEEMKKEEIKKLEEENKKKEDTDDL